MKRSQAEQRAAKPELDDPQSIDAQYGLEPVFEPGTDEGSDVIGAQTRLHFVQCPYCGESFQTLVDPSAGSTTYIEDCQICCQPIQFDLQIDQSGREVTLTVRRDD